MAPQAYADTGWALVASQPTDVSRAGQLRPPRVPDPFALEVEKNLEDHLDEFCRFRDALQVQAGMLASWYDRL